MNETQILKTIKLLKKTSKDLQFFPILYSHLIYLIESDKKIKIDSFCSDPFSQLLIYGAMKQKSPSKSLEKDALEFIRENKGVKNPSEKIILKIVIILCYCINLDNTKINFFIMNELINNYVFKNNFLDYLIFKYLYRGVALEVFDFQVKNRIQCDVITSFLLQCKNKTMTMASYLQIIPIYAFYDINPPNLSTNIIPNAFTYKIQESMHFYTKYTKSNKKVVEFLESINILLNGLENYIKGSFELINDDQIEKLYMKELIFKDNIDIQYLQSLFESYKDKVKFKKDLLKWLDTLG